MKAIKYPQDCYNRPTKEQTQVLENGNLIWWCFVHKLQSSHCQICMLQKWPCEMFTSVLWIKYLHFSHCSLNRKLPE